jgi:hypothetical protein
LVFLMLAAGLSCPAQQLFLSSGQSLPNRDRKGAISGNWIPDPQTAAAHYTVTAAARGYAMQRKVVEVQPDDRIEVTFMLTAESNK